MKKKLRAVPVMESKEPFYVLGLIDFMDIATYILDFAPTDKELKEDEKKNQQKKQLKH